MGLVFWSLTGLNASFFGQATSGRYQYMGVVFIVLIAAELLRGVVAPPLGGRDGARASRCSPTLANFSYLRDNANGLAGIAEKEKGGLAALELTRGRVAADFELTEDNSGVDYLGARRRRAVLLGDRRLRLAGVHARRARRRPPSSRAVAADMVFAAALGVELDAVRPAASPRPCMSVTSAQGPEIVAAAAGRRGAAGRARARRGSPLRRYATDEFPVALGALSPASRRGWRSPTDLSPQPWQLSLVGHGRVSVCALGGAA